MKKTKVMETLPVDVMRNQRANEIDSIALQIVLHVPSKDLKELRDAAVKRLTGRMSE